MSVFFLDKMLLLAVLLILLVLSIVVLYDKLLKPQLEEWLRPSKPKATVVYVKPYITVLQQTQSESEKAEAAKAEAAKAVPEKQVEAVPESVPEKQTDAVPETIVQLAGMDIESVTESDE